MVESKKAADKLKGKFPASAKDIRKYTQQIWLAGLGAFSRSDEEGGKFFEALVKAGEDIESRTKDAAGRVEEVRDRMKEKATDTFGRVERVFDDRISATLSRLGIPSQREIDSVHERLDEITDVLQSLAQAVQQSNRPSKDKGED